MSDVIALVDDDRNILTSVSISLQQEGFVTRVYSDAAIALKALADNPPDLGVFDIKMPGMDGIELLSRLREFSAVPVIFNGLRLGLIFALLGVVGGEIIASEHGLGQTLTVLAASFKTSGVFAVIILLALVGVCITWGMTWLENHLLRWR